MTDLVVAFKADGFPSVYDTIGPLAYHLVTPLSETDPRSLSM